MLNAYYEALPCIKLCVLGMLIRKPRNEVGIQDVIEDESKYLLYVFRKRDSQGCLSLPVLQYFEQLLPHLTLSGTTF